MRNTTFDNRRSSEQIFIGISLSLVFLVIEKLKTPLIVINTK